MLRDCILFTAFTEADLAVGLRNNPERVKEYQRTSRADGQSNSPLSRSWCGDFAYWVLKMSGATALPAAARPEGGGKWNTISRFFQVYAETTDPQPGDMYYMPKHYNASGQLVDVHHVGFIVDASGDKVQTVDGNSGTDFSKMLKGIGGAYVSRNNRDRSLITAYLRVCDETV